jgi:hypothetical protein
VLPSSCGYSATYLYIYSTALPCNADTTVMLAFIKVNIVLITLLRLLLTVSI